MIRKMATKSHEIKLVLWVFIFGTNLRIIRLQLSAGVEDVLKTDYFYWTISHFDIISKEFYSYHLHFQKETDMPHGSLRSLSSRHLNENTILWERFWNSSLASQGWKEVFSFWNYARTLKGHGRHGVLNNQQHDCFEHLIQANNKEIIKTRIAGRLWGKSTGDRWILLTRSASNAESISMTWRHYADETPSRSLDMTQF